MRKTLFALAASALIAGAAFVGCGGSDNPVIGDMAGKGDLAGADLSMPSTTKSGCSGYVTCLNDCFMANPMATSASCDTMCGKSSKPTAAGLFGTALRCGQDHCVGNADAMSGKCHLTCSGSSCTLINADGSMLDFTNDPTSGTTGTKDCAVCLNDSLDRLYKGMGCINMSSVDCNPTECKAATDACLNDTP